jgi:hypothetical protein
MGFWIPACAGMTCNANGVAAARPKGLPIACPHAWTTIGKLALADATRQSV